MDEYTQATVKHMGQLDSAHDTSMPDTDSTPSKGFHASSVRHAQQSLDIQDIVVQNPSATFFMKVEGDSMEPLGIFSNDIIAVDRSKEPREGCIVVLSINGEMLVRPFDMYKNDTNTAEEDCVLWGVVTGSVRQF